MNLPVGFRKLACSECRKGQALGFDIAMALQPIYDIKHQKIFAYEALVRTPDGGSAAEVFKRVHLGNQYLFDQTCRVKAIELAASLRLDTRLSINFMPNAIYKPELCIRTTLEAANECGFPLENIIFEFTEGEEVTDKTHLSNIVDHYRSQGFLTAIDDFGAGFSGLNLLADLDIDIIKIDMALIRRIDSHTRKQTIVKHITDMANALSVTVLAEGIETAAEFRMLQSLGIELFQGYFIGKPALGAAPEVSAEVLQLQR